MSARKNRPVLFEVVARTQRARRRGATLWPAATPPPTGSSTVPAPAEQSAEPRPRERVVSTAGGRLHLSVGRPHLVVAGVLLAAVLIAVYQAGARSASPPVTQPGGLDFLLTEAPPAEPEPVSAAPPTPARGRGSGTVVTPLGPSGDTTTPPTSIPVRDPGAPKEGPAEIFPFVADSYYVVAQHFPRRARTAADAARDFLRSKGIDSVVHSGQGDWMLVATQRFANEREATRLQARVRELGREYFTIGRYDFKEAGARKF